MSYIPLSLCMSWFHLLDFLLSQIHSTGSGGLCVCVCEVRGGRRELGVNSRQNSGKEINMP